MWNMKETVVRVIIGALGIILKNDGRTENSTVENNEYAKKCARGLSRNAAI